MLPPVDHSILQANPEFAALYTKLTTAVLNPDGSTKSGPATKERRAVTEELNEYRLRAAKQHLLKHAISNANPQSLQTQHAPVPSLSKSRPRPQQQETPASVDLPAPLLDLLLLLPTLLDAPSDLSHESVTLLLSNPPLSDFPTHLPQLARLVSSTLHASAVHLARIANPTTNPSFVHRSIPALPTYAASLASTVADRKAELSRARLSAATQLTALLREQAGVVSQLLRVLEAKHGPIARSLEFRATEAALTAQRQEAEAETTLWLARRETYTPEAARALANYASHLRDAKGRLNEAIRTLRAELEAYGLDGDDAGSNNGERTGKEKVMREMARVYRDMSRQIEEVRTDLERLGRA
ncbi:hypothetical protein MYCTH_2313216 [Thermothelomyces thermophilus ATCC 42464]|uniref:Uncharacterized protein n=1 Tax=Thermothelomyces thermophilus (strain ATCC 42464 / BCRC 31852 / DSM 1799) TaxID=573729 RepID=G2QNY0_THET4|nr:uncharacterized protein MYCTH_2313216 [Thermothelomyces thermophilus ATCC 42464]AEO62156.1 hypothetical protein MYCTH_2313216 [Thermothelomyces thermophilus ATCC 42464]